MTDYSLVSIIRLLHKWRKPIIYGTLGVAVLSAVVSLIVPVYYSSTTVFYAASEDLFKPKKVFGYGDNDVEYYGTSADIQRILTVATSYEVTDFLIEKYDLYEHYDVDPQKPKAKFIVREKLFSHYVVTRTKYDAIELSVEDQDPEYAAGMVNDARDKINNIIVGMIKGSQDKVIDSYEKTISEKQSALNIIKDSLEATQLEYGIFDAASQTEYLSTLITTSETQLINEQARLESYRNSSRADRDSIVKLEASIAGLEELIAVLNGDDTTSVSNYNIERFNSAKGNIRILADELFKATNNVNFDKELLKTLLSAKALDVPAMHVLEYGEVPIVKSRPKRSMMVLASTMAAFIFLVLGALFIESYRHLDWSFLKEW